MPKYAVIRLLSDGRHNGDTATLVEARDRWAALQLALTSHNDDAETIGDYRGRVKGTFAVYELDDGAVFTSTPRIHSDILFRDLT